MPGKHNAGGCGCCGCWGCGTEPETVAFTNSGSGCCDKPSGTYTVGQAASATLGSRNSYTPYDLDLHTFGPTAVASDCHWVWFHISSDFFCCSGGDAQFPSFGCLGPEARVLCQTDSYSSGGVTGEYAWAVAGPEMYVKWQRSPDKVVVVVRYYYYMRTCLSDGTNTLTTYEIHDEYVSSVTCGSLPATINWSARYNADGTERTNNDIVYGSGAGGPYTFTFCPSLASVSLTYA